ncbi:AAEL002139-PA [Aedes aegypti]|uniref:AAEL002139-PA n=2 Tax=Aedes aegypti TaxID=7159 RepID=A0A1S4F0U7_AEDAE|nr:putative mediator of RNA polymerase II transcription subunit 26 [Aedes aegypti]EAT46668.1 AAEL002139-PA [Aedes aegypti]
MLDGWYCRSMNEQALQQQQQQQHPHPSQSQRRNSLDGDDLGDRDGGDSSGQEEDSDEDIIPTRRNVDYKAQYNTLKKKLKYLLYENEFFQENLRTSQRRLLKVTRDRSFLLDRLLQYEKTDLTSSESEDTESSDDSSKMEPTPTVGRKRKNDPSTSNNASLVKNPPKRRKPGPKKQIPQHMVLQQQAILQQQRQHQAQIMAQLQAQSQQFHQQHQIVNNHHHHQQQQQQHQEGHLTTEEVERHLQSRAQSMLEVVPEGELPNEMFSQNPSSESNDQMVDTSPSNIGEECLSVDLNMMQQE